MDTNDSIIEVKKRPNTLGAFLIGAIAGATAGAVALLLTAPQPGEKTRADLKKGVGQFRDKTTEVVKERTEQVRTKANQIKADVQIKTGQLQSQGKGLIVKQLDRVSQLADAGKKAIQNSEEHVAV